MTMTGYVSAKEPEPRLTVTILDNRGTTVPIEAVIDTGFTGYMTLPIEIVSALGLERTRERMMRLADGSARRFRAYSAKIMWHGNMITISAPAMPGKPLIGMALLLGSDVAMAVREGGLVSITEPSEA